MRIHLSERVQQIKPSPTLAIAAKAAALKAAGVDVISLSTGEPDFDTPDFIKAKAIEAIQHGFTKYTAVEGILELRKAIANKFLQQNQLSYTPNQILISAGGKQVSLRNICCCLLLVALTLAGSVLWSFEIMFIFHGLILHCNLNDYYYKQ